MIKEEISQKYAELAQHMEKLPLYHQFGFVKPTKNILEAVGC